jgi:phage-related protein
MRAALPVYTPPATARRDLHLAEQRYREVVKERQ